MENKKFKVIIFILSTLLLVAVGFIVYDKVLKKDDNSIKTVINDMEIDLNVFYKVRDILNNLDKAFNDPSNNYFGKIYSDKNIMIGKLDKKVAAYASIYSEIERTNKPQYISSEKVKKNLRSMFGKYVEYVVGNIEWDNNSYMPYDEKTDMYVHQLPVVSKIKQPEFFANEISTVLKDGKIIVKRKTYYVEYETDALGTKRTKALIYTDKDKKTMITTMNLKDGHINQKEVLAKYSSKLNTYIYTFNEYKDTDYVLYSIEKER